MPNHVHGIIVINEESSVETTRRVVSTSVVSTTTTSKTLQPNSLGSIIGQFKSASTKRIKRLGYPDFAWQSRYYDHVIRNRKSLANIQRYISNNVLQWELDCYHPSGLVNWKP